jgi:hypothetical protein
LVACSQKVCSGIYGQFLFNHYSSDSPNAPLRFVLSGQENTRVHVNLFHDINNCFSVYHGVSIIRIGRYATSPKPLQSQNKITLIVTSISLPTGGTFCLTSDIPSDFYMFWIPFLGFECLLCSLAVFKGLQTLRSRRSVFRRGRLLVIILIRDSILYFFA